MKPGDYIETQKITKSGKAVTCKTITSTTGVKYLIGKYLGGGTFGKVYQARREHDHYPCVFKEYLPMPERKYLNNTIKNNIKNLMRSPLKDDKGNRLDSFVGPMDKDSLIELSASQSFGYIMEEVDRSQFHSVLELWDATLYPDAKILCTACENLAKLFRAVHFAGYCYKDVNEGNIYIHNKTGEVRIIDCDNISVQAKKTVLGTEGYMAPEVYQTNIPDTQTDYYSMAVLFYRMIIGGYPLHGKRTQKYLLDNDLTADEAAPEIYGKSALFAFDPNDRSNTIEGLVDPTNPYLYQIQLNRWNRLPQELCDGFIKTFSEGLSYQNKYHRMKDIDWMRLFAHLRDTSVALCPSCKRYVFINGHMQNECSFCKHSFGKAKELTQVVFAFQRNIDPKKGTITAKRKHVFPGNVLHPQLKDGWLTVLYNEQRNLLAIHNQSGYAWKVKDGTKQSICPDGKLQILKKDMIIEVIPGGFIMKVKDIQ